MGSIVTNLRYSQTDLTHTTVMLLLPALLVSLLCVFTRAEICDVTDDLSSCYRKFQSFEAIAQIHKHLDGDENGEVDSREAARFVRDAFCSTDCSRNRRSLTTDDPLVSLSDLWSMWQRNPASTWDVKDTVKWLIDCVNLPRYEDTFVRHLVDGKMLPLLAIQNMSYLTDVLLINNPIDKKRLMLKALDAVLFGPPPKLPMLSKGASLITASCGVFLLLLLGLSHWRYHNLASVAKRIDSSGCSTTEQILRQLQVRLDDLERLRYSLNKCEAKAELSSEAQPALNFRQISHSVGLDQWNSLSVDPSVQNRNRIIAEPTDWERDSTNSQGSLARGDSAWTIMEPDTCAVMRRRLEGELSSMDELMVWLQYTYELEAQQYRKKKLEAEMQLNEARQTCKRLNRKRYNILGSVRLLHSDSLDELEYRLMQAKHALERLQKELREMVHRWSRIEALTGFQITNNPGFSHLCAQLNTMPTAAPSLLDIMTTSSSSATIHDSLSPPSTAYGKNVEQTRDICPPQVNINVHANQAEVPVGSNRMGLSQTNTSASSTLKSNMPHNYSFVRPFAIIWRRKAGSRSSRAQSSIGSTFCKK